MLGIVMVNFRNWRDTIACIESIGAADATIPYRIYLVENGSGDDSNENLERHFTNSKIPLKILTQSTNLGFTGGVNAGIGAAVKENPTHIAIINNDTLVQKDFFFALSKALINHPQHVIAGEILNAQTGEPSHNLGKISRWTFIPKFIFSNKNEPFDWISLCFMVLPVEVIAQIGALKESLFLYCEDTELSIRLKANGVPLFQASDIIIRHKISSSVDGSGTKKNYYRMRNQVWVTFRYGNIFQISALLMRVCFSLIKHIGHSEIRKDFFDGLIDGIGGKLGIKIAHKNIKGPKIVFNALMLDGHLGGIGHYTRSLLKGLIQCRPHWQISLIVPHLLAKEFSDIPGLKIIEAPLESKKARLIWLHLFFPGLVKKYDFLHSVGNMGVPLCSIKQGITIHDTYEHVSPERFGYKKRHLMRLLISLSGRLSDIIFTDSNNSEKDISRFYPHLKKKLQVIPLGSRFDAIKNPNFGSRSDFLFVGTPEPGKNLAHLIKAFSKIPTEYNQFLKIVGGKGWRQENIPDLIESLGISGRVQWQGYLPDPELMKLFGSVVALVLPSNYEGFGLPALEAMNQGCPVILARNSSLIEVGGDAALFFETGNIEELAELMKTLMLNRPLQKTSIEKGLLQAKKYSWKIAAEKSAATISNTIQSSEEY